jgi:hypothetical protein
VVDESGNPFLITPPPGLLPARPVAAEPEGSDTVPAIELPPELGDSGTVRIAPSRAPVTARPPVAGGIPYSAPPAASAPPPVAPVLPSGADDETRVVAPKAPTWRLTLPDRQVLTVESALFVGRNPSRTIHDADGALLAVDDQTKSVSKTHAFIEVDAAGLWVTDLDSTNGVFVALPDDDDGVQAEPGERVPVPAGSDIVLGEFVIQVEKG